MRHYLYRHIRLDKNEPFYVGVGTKPLRTHNSVKSEYRRAYETNRKESHIWNNIVNKTSYEVEILLESNDYNFIKQKEIEFIFLYGRLNNNTGILSNMTNGGDGFIGYIPSKEKIEKHRQFMLGKKQPESQIKKRALSRKGYTHSNETKNKISKAHMGKTPSKEHFDKLIKGVIKARSKPILQYNLDGSFVREWDSATIAGKALGVHLSGIRNCISGIQKTAKNFIWKTKNIVS